MSLGAGQPTPDVEEPFWRRKTLDQMSDEEWESLCDGCGNCCRVKLEIEAPRGRADIVDTDVTCAYLDLESCRCLDYANRQRNVPTCLRLTPHLARTLPWLPETCAYRLVARGRDLHWWHPLVSGDSETVHQAGISVRGRCISEREVDNLEAIVADWLDWSDATD
ncbi:MAG: YcgN family cysteine cluster protein [Acidobacteriota bacterium]